MHGRNTPRHSQNAEKGYQVQDIFYTIQGEGPFAGLPAVFIRLTGCNLRCHWCDTVWDDEKDEYFTPHQIAEQVKRVALGCKLVVITGGEPCRWDLGPLIDELHDYRIQVETAGILWQQALLDSNVTVVCSPKVAKVHPKFMQYCDHWKYVVSAGDARPSDGLPIKGTQRPLTEGDPMRGGDMCRPPKDRPVNVYLQPCDEYDAEKNAANIKHMVEISLKYGYRAGLQLHKLFNVL